MTRAPLPLATAAQRLRGKPGRPRKSPPISEPDPGSAQAPQASVHPSTPLLARLPEPAVPKMCPRLLDVRGASLYTSLSPRSIRELVATGRLRRVVIPGANGHDMRRVLIDRLDLDAWIERWKTT